MSAGTEAQRVAELYDYIDPFAAPTPEIEDLVCDAAHVAGVPMATVNLLDAERQCQVAPIGFGGCTTPRRDAICNVTLELRAFVHIPDASKDVRFIDSPWVDGPLGDVRFYALRAPDHPPRPHHRDSVRVRYGTPPAHRRPDPRTRSSSLAASSKPSPATAEPTISRTGPTWRASGRRLQPKRGLLSRSRLPEANRRACRPRPDTRDRCPVRGVRLRITLSGRARHSSSWGTAAGGP